MNSVKKNFLYNSIYQILLLIISVFTTPYVSRVLGASGVGEISYVTSVISYFSLFAMLGVNNYGNRSIAAARDNSDQLSYEFNSIYLLQILSSLTSLCALVFYIIVFADDKLLYVVYVLQFLSSAIDISWFYYGIEKFKLIISRSLLIRLVSFFAFFIFVKEPDDLYIYALILTGCSFVSQGVLWSQLRKYTHYKRIYLKDCLIHLKNMFILFVPVIAVSLYKTMDKIMLGSMVSKLELGYYESCERVIQIPNAFISALCTVMLPRISNLVANGYSDLADKYFDSSIFISAFVASSMSFGIMGVADNFVPLFYGPGYEKCIEVFQYLMPHLIFLSVASVIRTQYLIPYKRDSIYLFSVLFGAVVNLFGNLILIPRYQANGAAAATFFAEMMVCILQAISIVKYKKLGKNLIDVCSLAAIGVIMNTAVHRIPLLGNHFYTLCVQFFTGVVVFVLLSLIYIKIRYKQTALEFIRKLG